MATIGFKANEQKLDDDFNDFNFDDFNFDVPEPKDDRHPVIKAIAPMGRGAKDYITNTSNIEKFVKAAMPRGYGQAYDLANEAAGELRQLYNSAAEEIKPVNESAKSLLRKALPSLDGKIPKKLKEKLENFSKAEEQWQGRQGDAREEQLGSLLSSIFEQKAEEQVRQRTEVNARDKIRQGFEQIRHRDTISQLDAIRIAAESQMQYQNKIGFNVQKKQLELSYRMFWAMADLNKEQKRSNAEMLAELKATSKNTGLPDYVKQTTPERFKELIRNKFLENTREGMFGGAQDYFRKFARNMGDQVLGRLRGYTQALSSAGDMASSMSDTMQGMGDMPGFNARDEIIAGLMQFPMDWLAEKGARAGSKVLNRNSKLRRGGSKASYIVNTFGDRFHEMLTNRERNWGSFEAIREMLVNAAPSNVPESRMEVDSLDRRHEPRPFSRSNSKSIDEIIPGLLARIHREIKVLRTGDESTPLVTYDFVKNKFTTDKKLAVDLRQRIAGNNTDRANKYADSILNKIDRAGKLSPEQRDRARKMLIEKSVMGESIDISKIGTAHSWGGDADGEAIANSFNRYLRAKDGKLPNNAMSYQRQIGLLQDHRGIVSGIGDPRVVLQQMVNAGQLDELRQMGILDENNNVNRKVYSEWLMNAAPQEDPSSTPASTTSIARSGRRVKKPSQHAPGAGLALKQLSGGDNTASAYRHGEEMLSELRNLSAVMRGEGKTGSTVERNVQSIADLLAVMDQKYMHASDANYAMFTMMLQRLSEIATQGAGGSGENKGGFFDNLKGQRAYTSLWEHLKGKAGEYGTKARAFSRLAIRRGKTLWAKYTPQVVEKVDRAGKAIGRQVTDLKGKLQGYYGDVIVSGEHFPRLRANLLKAGEYRDKVTGRVITSLEDITGDVVDSAGNVVITMEEFYNSYVTGSVNKRVKELFSQAKTKLEDWKERLQVFVPESIQRLRDSALNVFEKAKKLLPPYDVYVKTDMTRPLMYANMMRYEMYLSQRTGKVITHPREIDGPVIDDKGNIVISEEHIKQGLVDVAGDPVGNGPMRLLRKGARKAMQAWETMRDAAIGIFGSISKGLGNVGEYFKNFFSPFADIITNSRKTVNILQKIHDMLDARLPGGKKVRGDLDGDGVRDGSIADIRSRREADEDERDEDAAAGRGPAGLGMASLSKMMMNLTGRLKGKKKDSEDDEEDEDEDDDGSMLDDAADMAEIYDAMNGDGDRGDRGSRQRRRAAKKRLKRMKGKKPGFMRRMGGKLKGIGKWGMFNTDIVKGAGKAAGAVAKPVAKVGGAALSGAARVGAGAAAGLAGTSALAKVARWGMFNTDIVKGAGRVAGMAGKGALMGAGGMAAGARFLAPWLARGLGFALSWPVSLALTAGWAAYEGYKYLQKTKVTNLSTLRLAQYGVSVEDKDGVEKIFALESLLEPHAYLKSDGNLYLKEKDIDLKAVAELFEISRERDMHLFNLWYNRRFVPVYRKWLGEVRKINPDGKLSKIEAIVPGKDKLRIAESAVNSLDEPYRHMVGWNQARSKLAYDRQGVNNVLDSMRAALMKEREADGGEKAKVDARSAVAATTAEASKLAQKALTDKANYTVKDKDGNSVDASSMELGELTEKIKKGEMTVNVAVTVPKNLLHNDSGTLDALTSIRYKAYGLTQMSADKARMLSALEQFMGDYLTEDTESPKLKIGTERVMQVAGEVFGVPNETGEHANRWKVWFNGRFLPVFLLWASTIRQKTGKAKLLEAHRAFPLPEQLPLARAIIGAKGINASGAKVSVWQILSNPWSDPYELNSDPDTTAGNMEAIRQLADKVKLGEIGGKLNATNRQTDATKSDHGKGWNNPNRGVLSKIHNRNGVGVNATGDTIVSADKDAKPLSGIGDAVSFSGGGRGNYTDLPTPAGTGWGATRELLIKAAAMAGVDPRALISTIAVESSFNPNAAPSNPNLPSSAKGLGQHLDSSWMEDLRLHGKKFGIPNGTTQFDARASALMTASRLRHNGEQLEKNLGRKVTVTDLYLAHLMGLAGATKFLKSSPDAIAAEVAANTAQQHPEYFYENGKPLTVKAMYAKIAQKLAKRPAEFGVTDADMKGAGSSASDTAAAVPSAAPASSSAPAATAPAAAQSQAAPAPQVQRVSFSTTPSAGTPSLSGPVVMDKGKSAVIGTGPAMVAGKGVKYELILQREDSEEDGTYGTLRFPDGTVLNTLELPWKDNQSRVSCIPPGVYPCKKRPSQAFGEAYEVQQVPGRSAILIHAGNAAGSADKGMKADSQGCILLGMDRGRKGNQKIITASKAAMQLFHEKMADQPFTLIIRHGKNTLATTGDKSAVSFDAMRSTADPAAVPKQEARPQTTAPSFTPTAPRASSAPASTAPTTDLPLLNTTRTSINPAGPTPADMQQRDAAVTAVIAPKIDGIANTLLKSLETQTDGVGVLRQILGALQGSQQPAKPVVSSDTKVKPQTSTTVPVPQRRTV